MGIRHGWFWSGVMGAVLGYYAQGSGVNSRALVGWLVVAVGISGARRLHFAFDEPGWWAAQVESKGVGTVAWNTVWGLLSFAAIYAMIMGVAGLVAYGVAALL